MRHSNRDWWRKPDRTSLEEVAEKFKYFRIVQPKAKKWGILDSGASLGEQRVTEIPRLPYRALEDEDKSVRRVSLAPDVWSAIAGVFGEFSTEQLRSDMRLRKRAYKTVRGWYVYATRTYEGRLVVPNKHVADARVTGEIWALDPIEMELVGRIGGGAAPSAVEHVTKKVKMVARKANIFNHKLGCTFRFANEQAFVGGIQRLMSYVHKQDWFIEGCRKTGHPVADGMQVPTFHEATLLAKMLGYKVEVTDVKSPVKTFDFWIVSRRADTCKGRFRASDG
jgi:hypothetical protein